MTSLSYSLLKLQSSRLLGPQFTLGRIIPLVCQVGEVICVNEAECVDCVECNRLLLGFARVNKESDGAIR